MSNGTPARARETKRGTENDLLRRLLHRPALVDNLKLALTEAPYEAGLIKFIDANGAAVNKLLTEKGHQVAIGSSSKRGDPRVPESPAEAPSPQIPAWRILTKRRGVSDTLKAGSHAQKLRSLSTAPKTSPGDFPDFWHGRLHACDGDRATGSRRSREFHASRHYGLSTAWRSFLVGKSGFKVGGGRGSSI